MTMVAQIVARASRHRLLLRRVRSASGAWALPPRAVCAARDALAWRGRSGTSLPVAAAYSTDHKTVKPSLAISEAFDEDDNTDADTHDPDDDELSFGFDMDDEQHALGEEETLVQAQDGELVLPTALSSDEQRELAQRLRFAMDRKKRWMQRLADDGACDALLKVVYECYEPLYAAHPLLQHETCSLWGFYEDAVAVAGAETKFKPKWYDDQVTKITEQEAMSLFVSMARPELAMAVFRHREWLAAELGSVTLSRGENVLTDDVAIDFGKHFRSFYSWAMGASAALGDHAQVFAIYENALENGVFPTANMTLSYLNSLIAKREFEAVAALFEQIQKDDRPTNLYFYRQMLFVTRITGDSKTMDVLMKEMKIKGFKVRSEDYLNAIRSLDGLHYRSNTDKDDNTSEFFLNESYRECIARVADQEASPDKYVQREKASGNVIKLFEEMVEDEQIAPHNAAFFPRVISAALFLQDYDRVTEYVALHERCFDRPLVDVAALKMAVNALLVKDEPTAAWELILQAHSSSASKRSRDRRHGKTNSSVLSVVGNVVEYLSSHRETALVLQLLETLDAKKLLGPALVPAHSHRLLNTLVFDTKTVSNDQLWQMVSTKYWVAFPVSVNVKTLTQFVDACVTADRWWVVPKALHKRDRSKIPHLPARLALHLSNKALEDTTNPERVEMVASLAKMVDIPAMNTDTRVAFCCNVVRALHTLRGDSSRGLHRQREIRRIHDQYLRDKGVNLPQDVRAILMENA